MEPGSPLRYNLHPHRGSGPRHRSECGMEAEGYPYLRSEATRRHDRVETLTDIAQSYNVSPSTISRLAA
jgi:hypothetical protein